MPDVKRSMNGAFCDAESSDLLLKFRTPVHESLLSSLVQNLRTYGAPAVGAILFLRLP